MGMVWYSENAHLLQCRSEHACASAIYYQMDSVVKTIHYKAKHAISLKLDPTFLDAKDLILLSNDPRPWTLVCIWENWVHFHWNALFIEILIEKSSANVTFSSTLLYSQKWCSHARRMQQLQMDYMMHVMFSMEFFLKAYHQISPEPKMSICLLCWQTITWPTSFKCKNFGQTTRQ